MNEEGVHAVMGTLIQLFEPDDIETSSQQHKRLGHLLLLNATPFLDSPRPALLQVERTSWNCAKNTQRIEL